MKLLGRNKNKITKDKNGENVPHLEIPEVVLVHCNIVNNINNPYAKICAPDIVKDLNVGVFNLMSRNNETRHIKWDKTYKCICRLDKIICNSKQRWNEDKCRCECKELIDKGVCDKGYVWNPSNCECECDKSCNIGEYLDYSNCKKKLVDINETKLIKVTVENENKDSCRSYVGVICHILYD